MLTPAIAYAKRAGGIEKLRGIGARDRDRSAESDPAQRQLTGRDGRARRAGTKVRRQGPGGSSEKPAGRTVAGAALTSRAVANRLMKPQSSMRPSRARPRAR